MKILQLGNGGGLDIDQTNSSFLIDFNDEYLLFDCGFNIMQKLLELDKDNTSFKISKIKWIYISHDHADHIGNLETLIYYKYFILKDEPVNILLSPFNDSEIKLYLPKNDELKSGRLVNAGMYITNNLSQYHFLKIDDMFQISPFNSYHPGSNSSGIILKHSPKNNEFKTIMITGDTKALENIESLSFRHECELVFHDYSYWNNPSRNVHACDSDIESEYSEDFRNQLIRYHTGDDINFKKDWYVRPE